LDDSHIELLVVSFSEIVKFPKNRNYCSIYSLRVATQGRW